MTIAFIVIVAFFVIGVGSYLITKQTDSPAEELSETVIENQIEDVLGLDDDALKGKIDLTPSSPEPK